MSSSSPGQPGAGTVLVAGLVAAGHEGHRHHEDARQGGEVAGAGAEAVVLEGRLDREAVIAAVIAAAPELMVHEMTTLAHAEGTMPTSCSASRTIATRGPTTYDGRGAAGARRVVARGYAGASATAFAQGALKPEEDSVRLAAHAVIHTGPSGDRRVEEAVQRRRRRASCCATAAFYGQGTYDVLLEMLRKRQVPVVEQRTGV